ncbi:MAG TPA: hypothetical protein VNZ45_15235 [Bacteroidia bacterium]|jgi:hypothetical protein|nr:hypothetical protein [Bacteroidia bacterium]
MKSIPTLNRFLFAVLALIAPSLFACMSTYAQSPTKNDTVVLLASQVKVVDIKCYVASGYGSGDEELIAINSQPDVVTYFGYNCDVPDSDYTNYTLLCCSVMTIGEVKPKVKIAGDNLFLGLNMAKGTKREFLHFLVPKMGPNGNVHLDIYSPPPVREN